MKLVPWVFADTLEFPDNAIDWIDDLLAIAAFMKKLDPLSDRPQALLAFAERHVEDYPPSFGRFTPELRWAKIHAIRGEDASAVAALERFRDYGLFPYWRQEVFDNPALMGLRRNPEYQALLDDYRAFAEEERVRARELLEVES